MRYSRGVMCIVLMGLALPAMAAAQSHEPRLIQPPSFGTVHEVLGLTLPAVTPKPGCKTATTAGGACLDGLKLTDAPLRVVAFGQAGRPGSRIAGDYGRDFTLYDVWRDAKGIQVRALALPTSGLQVPRSCFALNGEHVGYGLSPAGTAPTATESQFVSCDGGPRAPQGPYQPEGRPIESASGGWHVTEMARIAGQRRYLAIPGPCEPKYSIRVTWCAAPAVTYMQTHPDQPELDLIAAHNPVQAGDVLDDKDLDQWVMKRKDNQQYKADGRWFKKSMMASVDGCTAVEGIRWYVEPDPDGLFITEKALSRCGAPTAPVPTATYEAYGDDLFVIDCADHAGWRDHDDKSPPDGCFDQARDYLHRIHQKSAYFVVLNSRAHRDDRLYDGGYVRYDVAEVKLNRDDTLSIHRQDGYVPDVSLPNCQPVSNGPHESQGFIIADSMGVRAARPFRWMACPAY